MPSEPLISARGLRKAFPRERAAPRLFWAALRGRQPAAEARIEVLHGIDLDIHRGDAVGVMGRNGAGKTTLLSIVSGVTQPTAGTIERRGRVAALLALTAGFHPHLSGRENARLFCAVQGVPRRNVPALLESIAAFADVGEYFDMPLRTYSSGMQARVAFGCAVHVDADVIVIDETLAVGDAAFRLKCYDQVRRMREDGQTFLIVSHSPNLIANFCSRAIVIEQGEKVFDGPTVDAIEYYKRIRVAVSDAETVRARHRRVPPAGVPEPGVALERLASRPAEGPFVRVEARLRALRPIGRLALNCGLRNHEGIVVASFDGLHGEAAIDDVRAGDVIDATIRFDDRLVAGRYFVSLLAGEVVADVVRPLGLFQNALALEVVRNGGGAGGLVNLGFRIDLAIHGPRSAQEPASTVPTP